MKKLTNLFFMLFVLLQMNHAENIKTIKVAFNISDFTLSEDSSNSLLDIYSNKQFVSYGENTSEPGLPLVPVNVLIPNGEVYAGLTVSSSKKLIRENITISANPKMMPTNYLEQNFTKDYPIYTGKIYPAASCVYKCTTCTGEYTMLNFLVSPFEYDAESKSLYFNESLTLTINLKTSNKKFSTTSNNSNNLSDIVRSLVINSEDVATSDISAQNSNNLTNNVEYLIVTSDALASNFQPIINWKRAKGIPSKIITIEDIKANYKGETTPLKIKSCLYDLYKNKGLKYVLLGGDDTIVPIEQCYVSAGGYIENSMPTDLFFACFGGSFDWDGNKNGVYGETTDNIDMSPSIYVTRIPVRTSLDIDAFSKKLLAYEKTPLEGVWDNNILMSGTKLWDRYSSSQSDAEAKGDNLYNNFIKPYWAGTRKKFYDTYTDFSGGANYTLNSSNLQEQFTKGYNFFDMATHGNVNMWALESGSYNSSDATNMKNNGFTIITTMACQTNQFDSPSCDPCLSEAFVRNANNGVVAYLGCSRYGWGYSGGSNQLGPSFQYEAQFYKNLFSTPIENKNFGAIVAASKAYLISQSTNNNPFRWVQFGLNPIGDPEMPIYTSIPRQFTGVSIKNESNGLKVNTGVDGCNICIMSIDDNGASYYDVQKNAKEAFFSNINGKVSVCITKQNYIPYFREINPPKFVYIQNETITSDKSYEADTIMLGSEVITTKTQGPVFMNSGTIKLKAKSITIEPTINISKDVKLTLSNK